MSKQEPADPPEASTRLIRLIQLWNYLPAFRAVAETEHLGAASATLHVSASALSRSVQKLEDQLGRPLFVRTGRHIRLNEEGRTLLNYLRKTMRLLDDSIDQINGVLEQGVVWMAGTSQVRWALLDLMHALYRESPEISPAENHIERAADIERSLLSGHVDMVLNTDPPHGEELEHHLLGTLRYGIYAHPRGHASLTARHGPGALELEQLAGARFVAVQSSQFRDAWPPSRARQVAVQTWDLDAARQLLARHAEAAREGDFDLLVVMPERYAQGHPEHCKPLPMSAAALAELPSHQLWVTRRKPVAQHDGERVMHAIDIIKRHVAASARPI